MVDEVPRLKQTAKEVKVKTVEVLAEIEAARAAVDAALNPETGKPKISEIRKASEALNTAVGNAPANMQFAADSLTEHAESVVTKAKADIEGMAVQHLGSTEVTSGLFPEPAEIVEGEVVEAEEV